MTEQEAIDGFNQIVNCVQIKLRDDAPNLYFIGDGIISRNSISFNDYSDTLKYLCEYIGEILSELLCITKRQSQRLIFGATNKNSALAFSKKMLSQCNKNMLPVMFICTEVNKSNVSEIEIYELSEKYKDIVYITFKSENAINLLAIRINFTFQIYKKRKKCNINLAKDILTDVEVYIKQELINLFKQIYVYFNNEKYDTSEILLDEILEEILDLQFPYRLDNVIDNDFAYKELKCFEFAKYATGELEIPSRLSKLRLEDVVVENLQCKKLYNLISFKLYQMHTENFYWNVYDFVKTLFLPPYSVMLRNFDCYIIAKAITDFYKKYEYLFADTIKTPVESKIVPSRSINTVIMQANRPNIPNREGFFCYRNSNTLQEMFSILSNIFDVYKIENIRMVCLDIHKKWRDYKYPFVFMEDYFIEHGESKHSEITKEIIEICTDPYTNIILEKFNVLMSLMMTDFDWQYYKSQITDNNIFDGMCLYIGCSQEELQEKINIYDWNHEAIKTMWGKDYFKDKYYGREKCMWKPV